VHCEESTGELRIGRGCLDEFRRRHHFDDLSDRGTGNPEPTTKQATSIRKGAGHAAHIQCAGAETDLRDLD
jgi:hypothetical protein